MILVKPLKILFVVTEDWYFCSHRLPLAISAKLAGYDVVVATRVADHKELIEQSGLRIIPLQRMRRSSLNVFREVASLGELFAIYRRERPDLVHQVALKPVIYGSLVARLIGTPARVNALGGLGFVFSSKKRLARLLRPILLWTFRLIFNNTHSQLILQNEDDLALMIEKAGVDRERVRLIRSAGVDLNRYIARDLPDGVPVVMLASRMIWDKGIGEFVSAARVLHDQGVSARFVLVGDPDPENPSSVPREQLQEWNDSGLVEWLGYRNDMPEVLSQASIVCLPSYYGEGIPKVLIEAMACARPIVTTDMPGCRELVHDGLNGCLVPPRNADALEKALSNLLNDPQVCVTMGVAGRKIVESEYSVLQVVSDTLNVYRELLD